MVGVSKVFFEVADRIEKIDRVVVRALTQPRECVYSVRYASRERGSPSGDDVVRGHRVWRIVSNEVYKVKSLLD